MKTLRLLQIGGDVHYPDAKSGSALADIKDKAMPPPFVDAVVPHKLQNVIRALTKLCQPNKHGERLNGILFCGDLTSIGDGSGYQECVEYLNNVLELTNANVWPRDHIHAVPGNHDVDRNLCSPTSPDLFGKFRPLAVAWENVGVPILQAGAIRQTTISADGCSAEVFSLNSCVGCGEKRFLPSKVGDELHKLLEKYVDGKRLEEAFSLVGEQLDTPAFLEDHMTSLRLAIDELKPTTIPVVLAHHNILPQAVVRVDIYTEVINGGLVRSRFSQCQHPVIYCHGHIHDDPIEIVSFPAPDSGPLISISAPLLSDGFNLIEVWYGQKRVAVGCVVIPYRIQRDGVVKREDSKVVRMPLRHASRYSDLGDHRIPSVLPPMRPWEYERFHEVLAKARAESGTHTQERSLAEPLLEAEWFGLVRILNREKDYEYWQIQRIAP